MAGQFLFGAYRQHPAIVHKRRVVSTVTTVWAKA
jgi:hypothetical protein